MFLVRGMKTGPCEANDKHLDKECFVVECQAGTFNGLMCVKCFQAQVKMRSKKPAELPFENGKPEGWRVAEA